MDPIGYVTIQEANDYVSTHYVSTDPLRTGWEAKSDSDKEVLLRCSFEILEMLPFTGRKYSDDQSTAFPRCPNDFVPDGVKHAQIENALSMSDAETSEDAALYERMWQYGVQSYSIGNFSESVSEGAYGRISGQSTGLVSSKAIRLIQPFLCGGYRLRGSHR